MHVGLGEILVLLGVIAVLGVPLGIATLLLMTRRRVDTQALESQVTATQRLTGERERLASEQSRLETERAEADAAARVWDEKVEAQQAELRAARDEIRTQRSATDRREQRLAEREDRIEEDNRALLARAESVEQLRADLDARQQHLAEAEQAQRATLERLAGLSADDARAELMASIEHDTRLKATALARDIEREAVRTAESKARSVIVGAIQRLASEQTSESVVSTVDLPSDDMKGRIIGREGRNIRAFEQITGVNVMIDDTPGSVLLSCFDPVRRETARVTLLELVQDGRIHPARIEEVHERSRARVDERCLRAAEDALAEVGIADLDPDLLPVLGSLRYRTSYGQNVLLHLVECAHLAGLMAAELQLDVAQCKRAAFLHDIGKALTHAVEGSHALVGADLARRHGESPDIVHAIEAHHNEVEPRTVEAVLTQAADAMSGSRPGARRESLEAYVKRLERLEEIARGHEGVDRVFAMQAGRELRVMVVPEMVDDAGSHSIARDIARQVEDELTYPGQIRVTVVRESRATETAH